MDDDSFEPNFDMFTFDFELSSSPDYLTTTLTCISSRPLSPEEYANALMEYARQLSVFENLTTEIAH